MTLEATDEAEELITRFCCRRQLAMRNCGTHKHTSGRHKTPTYSSWSGMLHRCLNVNAEAFPDYGGRGITVTPEWIGKNGFVTFLADMGERPSLMHSIDRVDNNRGYSKDNCRWATRKEQSSNTRRNVFIEFYGKSMTLADWSRVSLVSPKTIGKRLRSGWSARDAVWTPPLHAPHGRACPR